MRILLVEDNLTLANWLAKSLQQSNYSVDTVHDAADAEQALAFTEYDLVVLDLGLPDKTGLDVLEHIRGRGNEVPVIILTANASLDGRIRGLDAGADDYLAKPFELSELEARIRAHLRRASQRTAPVVTCGLLRFDTNTGCFHSETIRCRLHPKNMQFWSSFCGASEPPSARQHLFKVFTISTARLMRTPSRFTFIVCAKSWRAAKPRS